MDPVATSRGQATPSSDKCRWDREASNRARWLPLRGTVSGTHGGHPGGADQMKLEKLARLQPGIRSHGSSAREAA